MSGLVSEWVDDGTSLWMSGWVRQQASGWVK